MAPHLILLTRKENGMRWYFTMVDYLKRIRSVFFSITFGISQFQAKQLYCILAGLHFIFPSATRKTKNAREQNDVRKSTILSTRLVVFAKKMQYTRSLGRFIFLLFSLCCFTAAELLATKSHALAISEFSKLFSIHNQTKNSNAHTYEYIDHGTCLSCFFYLVVRKKKKNAYTCITVSIAVTIHLLLISTCM